jgi:zinc finger protein CreA/MIG
MDHGADQPPTLSANGHISAQGHLVHAGYSPPLPIVGSGGGGGGGGGGGLPSRFDSPPPILAPIQDERVMRGDHRHSQMQLQASSSPYLHHPQPLGTDYQYHQSMSYNNGLRSKGVGALVQ